MTATAIVHANLVLADRVVEDCPLTIEHGRIAAIGEPPPPGAEVIEARGRLVLPGLIDLHAHGRLALPSPDTVVERLRQDAREFAGHGVSAYLVTFASSPLENWLESLAVLAEEFTKPTPGAEPLGVHLEGIFINPAAAGAQPADWIMPFDPDRPGHRELFERFGSLVKIMSFAPEVPGNERLIEFCLERGIVPAIGHTCASAEQVHGFAERGARHMTHLMNAMKGIHHREPGPVPAGLLDDRISVELICDGFHLHPEMVRLVHRLKPPDRRLLISDAVLSALPGAESGNLDEPNRLPDGRLAGSRLRLCRAVKNYHEFTGCPLYEAAALASLYPARALGVDRERGSLDPGKRADLWIASPSLEPEAVFIGGTRSW